MCNPIAVKDRRCLFRIPVEISAPVSLETGLESLWDFYSCEAIATTVFCAERKPESDLLCFKNDSIYRYTFYLL
jgi:hypothetical protein